MIETSAHDATAEAIPDATKPFPQLVENGCWRLFEYRYYGDRYPVTGFHSVIYKYKGNGVYTESLRNPFSLLGKYHSCIQKDYLIILNREGVVQSSQKLLDLECSGELRTEHIQFIKIGGLLHKYLYPDEGCDCDPEVLVYYFTPNDEGCGNI